MSVSSDRRHSASAALADDLAAAKQVATWPGLYPAAATIGVVLSAAQLDRFAAYQALLVEWNSRFNLTAITDPATIEERLFWDALLLAPTIDALTMDAATPNVVDIGSGAGFPALPLAIVRPDWRYTLIEATGKKVAFLDQVIGALDLRSVRTIHGRAEDVARDPAQRGGWEIATARAVASLPALVELTMPLVRVGGHAILPKGGALAAELAAGERAATLVGARITEAARAPGTSTRLVVVTKTRRTPAAYPRRAGIPARAPLGMAGAAPPRGAGASPPAGRTTLAGG